MANAIQNSFLGSEFDVTSLSQSEAGTFLTRLANSNVPGLFGTETADVDAPALALIESPVWDERFDRIEFDDENGKPRHRRGLLVGESEAQVDLAIGFRGEECPVVYKHINQLAGIEDNPLRWRFTVVDRGTRVAPTGVVVRIRARADDEGEEASENWTELPARVVTPVEDEHGTYGYIFEVVALRGQIPALAAVEGIFDIEIAARDWADNVAAPLRGCWTHRPMAAPVRVGPVAYAQGPMALESRGLETDNLGVLIRGAPVEADAAIVADFAMHNPNDDPVYLSVGFEEFAGEYRFVWRWDHQGIRQEARPSNCLSEGGYCGLEAPRARTELEVPSTALRVETMSFRVLDSESGASAACFDCQDGEFLLLPGKHYRGELVVTDLGFLVPSEDDGDGVTRSLVEEFPIDPSGGAPVLTGVLQGEYVQCVTPGANAGQCNVEERFVLFGALREARVNVEDLRLSFAARAHGHHSPSLPAPAYADPRTTLAQPKTFSFLWSTREPGIP